MSYDEEQKFNAGHDNPQVGQWGSWVSADRETDIFGFVWRRIGRKEHPLTLGCIVYTILIFGALYYGFYYLYSLFYDAVHIGIK